VNPWFLLINNPVSYLLINADETVVVKSLEGGLDDIVGVSTCENKKLFEFEEEKKNGLGIEMGRGPGAEWRVRVILDFQPGTLSVG
jgi:hypothetical protein